MYDQEQEWLASARKGDEAAFGFIVESYQVPVYNLCYRMLANAEAAEDAAQEVFLKAFRNLHRYDPERRFTTWLLSIASHHCIDILRRRRIQESSLEDLLPSQMPSDPNPGPEAAYAQREYQEEVRAILRGLAPLDRAVIVLRYWYDLSYEEIAETLSQSVSAIKSRLHRTRRNLAQAWLETGAQGMVINGRREQAPTV